MVEIVRKRGGRVTRSKIDTPRPRKTGKLSLALSKDRKAELAPKAKARAKPDFGRKAASAPMPGIVRRLAKLQQAGDEEAFQKIVSKLEPKQAAAWRRHKARQAVDWLRATWPHLFAGPVPLAIGAGEEIRAARPSHISNADIRAAIAKWVNSKPYLKALAKGGDRIGLDGEIAGQVTDGEMAGARERLRGR